MNKSLSNKSFNRYRPEILFNQNRYVMAVCTKINTPAPLRIVLPFQGYQYLHPLTL